MTAQRHAQTWVLFTTASTVAHAVAEYAQRMSIEETFRDWHSRWGVRAARWSPDGSDGRPADRGGLFDR